MYQQSNADVNTIREAVVRQVEVERLVHSSPGLSQQQISETELWKAVNSGEDGDAWLFAQIHRAQLVYDHAAGCWYEWSTHYWVEDQSEEVIGRVDAVIDAYAEGARRAAWERLKASKANDKTTAEEAEARESAYLAHVSKLQSLHRKRNILTLAAAGKRSLGITGDEWDRNPWLIACLNGVIDLMTGQLRPGRQEDYIKTFCPVKWTGLDTKAPAWEAFLLEILNNMIVLVLFLQRLLGYAITGLHTEHIFPILWGIGRNGKGTLLEILKYVLGLIAGPIKAEMLLDQGRVRSSAAPDSDIMDLRGKRLVWASETSEGRKLEAGKVKWLVGGDTLCGRTPYGRREVQFEPTHTLFLLTNHKPKADPSDFALWERILLVPFTLSFVDEPRQEHERRRDPHLAEKLKAEASGILAWLVRGCLAWQREGLNPPAMVRAATRSYQESEDDLARFILDCCVVGEFATVKAGKLYQAYEIWCKTYNYSRLGGKRFGEYFKDRFSFERKTAGVFYSGIGLNVEPKPDEGTM
jgi:putative DNA primase/helicase